MIEKSDGRLTYLWIVKFRIKITMMMDRADTRHGTRTKTTLRWPMLRCLLASWANIQQADKGSGWLDDSFKTVCRVRECDTADECGCGDDGDGDGGDDGVSVNISHTPHSTFSRHPDTALWKFLGGQKLCNMIFYLLLCDDLKSAPYFCILQNPLAAKNILFFRIQNCHRNIHSALFWPDWAGAGVKISGKEAPPPPACAASRDNDNDNDRYPHPAGNWLETGNINISRFSSQDPATQLYNSFFGLSAITDAGGMKSRGSDM